MIDIDIQKALGNFRINARIATQSDGIIALFGRSGSGKTSIMNLIAGLARPDNGHIVIGEETLFNAASGIHLPPNKRRLGYVFQEDRLFPHLSVERNLRYGSPKAPDRSNNERFDKIVSILDIGPLLNRRPANLSGGEKQRVSIGRALLADPRLLLMDEPLASLGAVHKEEILHLIEEMSAELRLPIIYVTHAMDEIVRLADQLALVTDGEIAAFGGVEELTSRLDLRPMTGRYEAGSVVKVRVSSHSAEDALSHLSFAGGEFSVPKVPLDVGQELRIRVRARDVSIATTEPKNISINNIFSGTIKEISEESGALLDVLVDTGAPIWARVSRHSVSRLGLSPGKKVYIMIKAVAIDRFSRGGIGRGREEL